MSIEHGTAQEVRFARVASGARIAWARTGRPDAPTMVRVAHWLTNVGYDLHSPLWRPWIERLSRSFRLVRYDERGCGLSSADDLAMDLESLVEELEAVIEAHGESRVALLGVSGATPVAIAYAARHPERVSHMFWTGDCRQGRAEGHGTLTVDGEVYEVTNSRDWRAAGAYLHVVVRKQRR